MDTGMANTALQLRSLVRGNGELELSLVTLAVPVPRPDEVLVRVEAAPSILPTRDSCSAPPT